MVLLLRGCWMDKLTGFTEFARSSVPYRDPLERLKDFSEIFTTPDEIHIKTQGARCMDCGVPFCQSADGCPVDNLIPEWNDLVFRGEWEQALARLEETNNFPEFTGRVCPAPCEGACVLGIIDPAVTIKNIENEIIDRGFVEGWVTPHLPRSDCRVRTGRTGCSRPTQPGGTPCHCLRTGRPDWRTFNVRNSKHETRPGCGGS